MCTHKAPLWQNGRRSSVNRLRGCPSAATLGEAVSRVWEHRLRTIGKYEITAEVGRGAMGEVYKARDPLIGRMVALKVITSGLSGRPELLDRFYQEARSAGALQHPNIVTVYELGKEGELPFIAMEYLGGESLEKMIGRHAPMPLAQKVGYIVQICRALEYAHKHGVVHRDIKPGNIMTTSEGAIKVVDFGIARLVDASKTQTGTLIGTLGYMSPQQLRGEHADERSDIWAVGVLFYELVTYKRPFQGDNPAALMMTIISEEPASLDSSDTACSRELAIIVSRMLKKEVADRYQTMEEVLLDLDPVYRQLQQSRVADLVAESERMIEAEDLKGAQQLLRDALHADSSHAEAKSLLEKVSKALRHRQVLPKVKEQLAKAQEMLDAGQFQQAKVEVQAAIQLDSTFPPAREMLEEVKRASERAREVDAKLRTAQQRVAEGALTDADREIGDLLALHPQNVQAQELRRQIQDEVARRQQRRHLADALRHARDLWSQLRYAECIAELEGLRNEFPGNPEIDKLLESARRDQGEGEKQKRLTEARNLLTSQRYEEAQSSLASLQKEFPGDQAVQNLLALAQDEQASSARQQRLQGELGRLRGLVTEGKYAQVLEDAESLRPEFPAEFELTELIDFARGEVQRAEQSRRHNEAIQRVSDLIVRDSFEEAGQAANESLAEFPDSAELKKLHEEATRKAQEKQRQEQMELRIREMKTRLQRKDLTGAIELAQETIATLGSNTSIERLLEAAQADRRKRELKKWRDLRIAEARSLLMDGKEDAAGKVVSDALAAQELEVVDPEVKALVVEIEGKKRTRIATPPAAAAVSTPIERAQNAAAAGGAPQSVLAPAAGNHTAAEAIDHVKSVPPLARPTSKRTPWIAAAAIAVAAVIGGGIYFRTGRSKTTSPTAAKQPASSANRLPAAPAGSMAPPERSSSTPVPSAPAASPAVPATAVASPSASTPTAGRIAQQPAPQEQLAAASAIPSRTHSGGLADAAYQLRQLIRQYNAGTDDPDDLQKLQQEFRGLEKANGTVGSQARLYAEQRIPADLKDLESSATLPPPAATSHPAASSSVSSSAASGKRYLWVAAVDSSTVTGLRIQAHPLPIGLVAKLETGHNQLELRFSIDPQGRVTDGRVLSGNGILGQEVVSEAIKSWHFSVPQGSNASASVFLQF